MAKAFLDGNWMSCLQDNPLYNTTIEVLPYTNAPGAQAQPRAVENQVYASPSPNLNQVYTSPPPTPLVPYAVGYGSATDSTLTAGLARMMISPQPSTTYTNFARMTNTPHQANTYMNIARAVPARPEPEYVSSFGPARNLLPNGDEGTDADVESVYDEARVEPAAPHEMNPLELAEMRRIEEMAREWRRRCARKMIELATDTTLDATSEDDLLELIAHATASLQRRHRSVPGYQA